MTKPVDRGRQIKLNSMDCPLLRTSMWHKQRAPLKPKLLMLYDVGYALAFFWMLPPSMDCSGSQDQMQYCLILEIWLNSCKIRASPILLFNSLLTCSYKANQKYHSLVNLTTSTKKYIPHTLQGNSQTKTSLHEIVVFPYCQCGRKHLACLSYVADVKCLGKKNNWWNLPNYQDLNT